MLFRYTISLFVLSGCVANKLDNKRSSEGHKVQVPEQVAMQEPEPAPLTKTPEIETSPVAPLEQTITQIIIQNNAEAVDGGTTVGNGGDAVVCRNQITKSIESVQLLDFFEARSLGEDITLDLGLQSLGVKEKINVVIKRLALVDPERAKIIADEAETFHANTHFLPGMALNNAPDSMHIAAPTNCKVEQLALQNTSQKFSGKYYTIAKDLFDQLSVDDQAGLILHEILYREYLTYYPDLKDSSNVRAYNVLLASTRFSGLTQDQYAKERQALGYPLFYHGLNLLSEEYLANGDFAGLSASEQKLLIDDQSFSVGKGAKIVFHGENVSSVEALSLQAYFGAKKITCDVEKKGTFFSVNFLYDNIKDVKSFDPLICNLEGSQQNYPNIFRTLEIVFGPYDYSIRAYGEDRSRFYYFDGERKFHLIPCPDEPVFFYRNGFVRYLKHCPNRDMTEIYKHVVTFDGASSYYLVKSWFFSFTEEGLISYGIEN